jgi:ectoine hydroxylase-related dioxygenase (phytanoyl-CoA dioxygenase family)
MTPDGPCTPHLSTERYKLADTVAVPARRGDVVCFNINTIHGSHVNVTNRPRRLVRLGYRDPENRQISGQSLNRPGLLVAGIRPRGEGKQPFSTECAG